MERANIFTLYLICCNIFKRGKGKKRKNKKTLLFLNLVEKHFENSAIWMNEQDR